MPGSPLPEKPTSIWLSQILFGLILVPTGLILPVALAVCVAEGGLGRCLTVSNLALGAVVLGGCGLLGVAGWGLEVRLRFSRWLAIALLSALSAILLSRSELIGGVAQGIGRQRPIQDFAPGGDLLLRAILQAAVYAVPVGLALRLAIAPEVKQYFRGDR